MAPIGLEVMFPHQVTFVYYRYIMIYDFNVNVCLIFVFPKVCITINIFCNETTISNLVRCDFALLQIVVVGVWNDLKGIQSQQLKVWMLIL